MYWLSRSLHRFPVWAALSDFIMASLPALLLWNLQISRKLKVGLSCLMGLGVLAGAAAIVKVINVQKVLTVDQSCKFQS